MDANEKDDETQKLKGELQQIKETNSNQFCGPSMMQMMMQMGSQIDEKFGKMEKEMDGLKSANQEVIRAFKGLKEEFEKMAGENAGLKRKMDNMNKEFAGKTAKMDEMEKKMKEIVAKNAELKGRIVEKDEEMKKMKTAFDGKIVEFEAKMREDKEMLVNLTGRIDGMDFVQMNNEWNPANCGPKLAISEGGLFVKHSAYQNGWNCIRAISSISPFNSNATKPSIAGYFEAQIVTGWVGGFRFGFCTQQFPLEGKWLGDGANSIGIHHKAGINIDGRFSRFGNNADGYFKSGDLIGVGIIHYPANKSMKCFSMCNGELLGIVELPDKFAPLQLFPAASLYSEGDSIRANFGQETLRFDASQFLQ